MQWPSRLRSCARRSLGPRGGHRRPLGLGVGQPEPAGPDDPGGRVRGRTRVCRGLVRDAAQHRRRRDDLARRGHGPDRCAAAHQPDRRRLPRRSGGSCALRRSDDGGQTFTRLPWTATDLRCAAPVAAFDFPTDQTGYLALEDGSVLSTADGGRTWSRKTSIPVTRRGQPAVQADRHHVPHADDRGRREPVRRDLPDHGRGELVDPGPRGHRRSSTASTSVTALVGYAVGSGGIVLRTDDGGLTWTAEGAAPAGGAAQHPLRHAARLPADERRPKPCCAPSTERATWSSVTASTQKIQAASFSSPTERSRPATAGPQCSPTTRARRGVRSASGSARPSQRVRALSASVRVRDRARAARSRARTTVESRGPRSACRRRRT